MASFIGYVLLTTMAVSGSHALPAKKVVNAHPFIYNLNNEFLCNSQPDTLIWVHTAPSHTRRRSLLRETWANPSYFHTRTVKLVFFLGLTIDAKVQKLIEYESDTYKDIVQETFIDSYRNLTYKAIAGCKWTATFCPSADIILKTDDDMVVNIFLLFKHISLLQSKGKVQSNTILCDVWHNRKPQRNTDKWKVSMEEYADKTYPPYCPGLGVVMTGDIIPKLYMASFREPFFWVDDVYFTGLLAKTINVNFEQIGATMHFGPSKLVASDVWFSNKYKFLFFHVKSHQLFVQLWRMIHSYHSSQQLNNEGRTRLTV